MLLYFEKPGGAGQYSDAGSAVDWLSDNEETEQPVKVGPIIAKRRAVLENIMRSSKKDLETRKLN